MIHRSDCIDILRTLPDGSIDMILQDPPYNMTACKWECDLDFPALWKEWARVIKDNGAIVMTASQPFTTDLINSNRAWFRYEWIWEKDSPVNPLVAPNRVMPRHENIIVFYGKQPIYNPQMEQRKHFRNNAPAEFTTESKGDVVLSRKLSAMSELMHPSSVIKINRDIDRGMHPTQKPVKLYEWILMNYAQKGQNILDTHFGSLSIGIACDRLGFDLTAFEIDAEYFEAGRKRLEEHQRQGVLCL